MIDIGKIKGSLFAYSFDKLRSFLLLKVVSFDKLMSGTRICEPFELDFPKQSDSVAVSLKVGQNKKLEVNLLFRLEDRKKKASPQDQGISFKENQVEFWQR